MRFQILFFITILSFAAIFSACGNQTATNTTTENKTTVNTTSANSNNPLGTTKAPEAATTNAAPTIAPVVQNYYDAWKKKDDAALRKVFSQATLKSFEADMKADKKASLSDWFSYNETLPEKPFEVRNEKIEGETAIAEIKGGSYGVWTPVKFVRENGEWKMTNESPDVESVKKSADSNSAK